MSSEQVIVCESACVVTVRHEFVIPPFNLTLVEGLQIATAICLCWAVGFVIRSYRHAINLSTGERDSYE